MNSYIKNDNYLNERVFLSKMATSEQKSPEDSRSVWSKYGLRESPFTTIPTRLLGILPIGKETERLIKILISSNTTRTVVLGDFGVGKTTFVNYVKWRLCLRNKSKSEFVTTPVEIKIQPQWDAEKFLLSTLSSVYNASIIFKWEDEGITLQSLKKIEEYVTIGTQRGVQGTVGVFGGGYSETKSVPSTISPEVYESLLNSLCLELRERGKQLIISYDNMENIKRDELADFFRTIKDYIQIEGLHTIFIGPPTCLSALEKYPQVHTVFTQPIILESLTEENVLDVLRKRCEALKFQQGNYIPPYDDSTVRKTYQKLNNIRFTFKILEDTTFATESQAPCKITMNEIIAVQEKEKKEILSKLSNQESKIIGTLMNVQDSKVNLSRLSTLTKIGTTNLRGPLTELESKGLIIISISEEDKRIKYVRLSDNSYLRAFFTAADLKK